MHGFNSRVVYLGVDFKLLICYGFYFVRSSLWDTSLNGLTIAKRKNKGVILLDLFKVGILFRRGLSFVNLLGQSGVYGFLFLEQVKVEYLQKLFYFFDIFFKHYRRSWRFFFLAHSWFPGYLTNFSRILSPLLLRVKQGLVSDYEIFSWQLPIIYPRAVVSGDIVSYKLALNEANLLNIPSLVLLKGGVSFDSDVIPYLLPANAINLSTRLFFYKMVIGSWVSGFLFSGIWSIFFSLLRRRRNKVVLGNRRKLFSRNFLKVRGFMNLSAFNELHNKMNLVKVLLEENSIKVVVDHKENKENINVSVAS